jgi:NAD(P)-dependent dehydrogenase (short-subunit alcohol dehydrogenase family)
MTINPKMREVVSLEGKVAMVSGAASGIGRGVALRLADAGAAVIVLDVDEAKGKVVAGEIAMGGRKSLAMRCDVRSGEDCKAAVDETVRRFGSIDILCNNAGVVVRKNVVDLSEEEWDKVVDTGLKGVYLLSHYVIPQMLRSGGGTIINIGSGWSLKGGPNAVAYCAAKAGVLNLTRAMAIDHGKDNIRVNCVCPGDVDTPLLRDEARQLSANIAEFMKEAAERPVGRVGTPEDIANAVLFFASDLSLWVTGTHLVVDGGGIA